MKSSADGPRSSKSSKNDNKASAPQMNPLTRQGGDDPTTVDPDAPKRIRPKVKEAVPRQSSFKKAAPQAKVETKKKKEEGKIRRASRRFSAAAASLFGPSKIPPPPRPSLEPPPEPPPPRPSLEPSPPPLPKQDPPPQVDRKKKVIRAISGDDSDFDSEEENDNFESPEVLDRSFSFKDALKSKASFSEEELREKETEGELEDVVFDDENKLEWTGSDSDDEEDEEDMDLFSMDKDRLTLELTGPPKCDHRFHLFFAVILHLLSGVVTYFSIIYALEPKVLQNELYCKLLAPYSILAVCMVMLGTDNIDPRLDLLPQGLGVFDFIKTFLRSPNLAFTCLNVAAQRVALSIGALSEGDVGKGAINILSLLVMIPAARVLYRQRIKMSVTVPDDKKQDLPSERASGRRRQVNSKTGSNSLSRGLSRASTTNMDNSKIHAENYEKLRLTNSKFKDLVLTELPKVGFATFLTVAYFSFDAYGCLHRVKHEESIWEQEHQGEQVKYCYEYVAEIGVDNCQSSLEEECIAGPGECEDIVHSSETFSFLFVVAGILKIYTVPLATLRYNPVHLMQFDMLFRDQIQCILFALSGAIALLVFASSDEISTSDWCSYVNPAYKREGEDLFGKRSRSWRLTSNNIVKVLFVLVIVIMGMTKDEQKVAQTRIGKVAHWLHMRMKTREPLSVAPVIRAGMFAAAVGLCLFVSCPFVMFSALAMKDGTPTSKWARWAEDMYAVFLSTWTILFCNVGLFFMSRAQTSKVDKKKKLVYAMLPLQSALIATGCYLLSRWEEEAGMKEMIFFRYSLNNLAFCVLSLLFYPIVRRCFKLLSDEDTYSERQVQGHISNLFVQATALLAPACFLFAEGTGCVHAHSYRGCFALIQSNFTVQVHLILSYGYYLLYGFTIYKVTYDDILNFTAPTSLIIQFMFMSLSALLAFAVFGMRPRDIDDNEANDDKFDCGNLTPSDLTISFTECTDGNPAPLQLASDASFGATRNCQYVIFGLWVFNYIVQGFYVHREGRKILLGNLSERSRRKQHRSDHAVEDALVKGETFFIHKIEQMYRVVNGDHDTKISRIYNDMAFVVIAFSFGLAVYLYACIPSLEKEDKFANTTSTDQYMYYNSSTAKQQDDKEAGYYYGVWLAISDLMHVCAILACFSNLNKDITIRRRVMEAIIVIFVAGEVVLLGFQPEVKIADGGNILFVLAFLLFSGMLLVLKAKDELVKNYAPIEIKKHVLKMAMVTFSQLPPIIFLQTEYIGCLSRAYEYSELTEEGEEPKPYFSVVTVGDGTYCGRIRQGSKSVTFQISMMIIMAWTNGIFTRYSEDELTIAKISKLDMNPFNVYQLLMFMTTSMLCLFMFGTRGKSVEYYRGDTTMNMAESSDLLLVIYFMWWVLIMSDVGRRLYQLLYADDKFLEDLHHEQQVELEEINDPKVKPQKRGRKSVWDLKSVTTVSECDDLKAEKEHAEKIRQQKIEGRGSKFTRIKGRKSEDHGAFFDFSPGML